MPDIDPCLAPPIIGGRIGSPQGWRRRQDGSDRWHNGVDIMAPEGTPILAIADGIIDRVYAAGAPGVRGYGNVVLLRHAHAGEWFSMYAHCASTRADEGATVRTGEAIATVGSTAGYPDRPAFQWSGPHLHLEAVSRWPLRAEDLAHRFDVAATLAALGIDASGRFRWIGCGATAAPRAQAPGAPPPPTPAAAPGRSDLALPILALGVIIAARRRRT